MVATWSESIKTSPSLHPPGLGVGGPATCATHPAEGPPSGPGGPPCLLPCPPWTPGAPVPHAHAAAGCSGPRRVETRSRRGAMAAADPLYPPVAAAIPPVAAADPVASAASQGGRGRGWSPVASKPHGGAAGILARLQRSWPVSRSGTRASGPSPSRGPRRARRVLGGCARAGPAAAAAVAASQGLCSCTSGRRPPCFGEGGGRPFPASPCPGETLVCSLTQLSCPSPRLGPRSDLSLRPALLSQC